MLRARIATLGLLLLTGCTAQSSPPGSRGAAPKPERSTPTAPAYVAARTLPALSTALRASTVTSAGQRLAHDVGGFLDIALPARASEPVRLSRTNDLWISLTAIGDGDVAAIVEGGAARFEGAQRGVDVLHLAHALGAETAFEEVRVVTDAKAPSAFSWRVHAGAAVADVRAIVGMIEVVDHAGRAHVRSPKPWVVDAKGTRRDALWSVAREPGSAHDWIVTASFDAASLAYPVVLDPAWLATTAMAQPRYGMPTVTLNDGRVIVVSGGAGIAGDTDSGCSSAIDTSEVFDPGTSTWTTTGAMGAGRVRHGAAILPSGKVITAGGIDATCSYSASAEIWDPKTNAWTPAAPIALGVYGISLVATGNGTVLRAGGWNTQPPTNGAETFNETTGAWTPTANPMQVGRMLYGTSLLKNGNVLITGGLYQSSGIYDWNLCDIYDPTTNLFSVASPMGSARGSHTQATLSDGRILVAGGTNNSEFSWSSQVTTAETFDPATGIWTTVAPIEGTGRASAMMATVSGAGGLTYLFGGITSASGTMSTVLTFDPTTNAWGSGGAMHVGRALGFAFSTSTGAVYVGGGVSAAQSVGAISGVETLGTSIASGATCATNEECATGFCADGVCCNVACTSTCQACDEPGSVGSCITIHGAPRGSRGCATPGGDPTCGQSCDGSTIAACTFPTSATPCALATCDASGNYAPSSSCNGSGTCAANGTAVACAPYGCGVTGCVTKCSVDKDCAVGSACDATSGSCVAKLGNGAAATRAGQCVSGILADGVCCDSACTSACQTCAKSGSVGACVPVDGVPDPHDLCAPGPCGDLCNAGACGVKSAGTICSAATCASATVTLAATCDGATSACPGSTPAPCPGGFVCESATACKTRCAGDADCAIGVCDPMTFLCVAETPIDAGSDAESDAGVDAGFDATATDAGIVDTSTTDLGVAIDTGSDVATSTDALPATDASNAALGSVVPPPLSSAVTTCVADTDCPGAFCVDGICCNTPCNQKCFTCSLATSPGTCVPSPLGLDPKAECGTPDQCTATCDGAGACTAAFKGTQCAPNQCTGVTTGIGPAFCTAQDQPCVTWTTAPFDCTPFACSPAFGTCYGKCTKSDQCAPGFVCDTTSGNCATTTPSSSPSGGCAIGPGAGHRDDGGASVAIAIGALAIVVGARRRRRSVA